MRDWFNNFQQQHGRPPGKEDWKNIKINVETTRQSEAYRKRCERIALVIDPAVLESDPIAL